MSVLDKRSNLMAFSSTVGSPISVFGSSILHAETNITYISVILTDVDDGMAYRKGMESKSSMQEEIEGMVT